MAIFLAYVLVVLVWATTPLAIQWSSDSISFIAAAAARVIVAAPIALCIYTVRTGKFLPLLRHWKMFAAASLSIFPNMPVIYWSAQFIPSGLVAVIFSLSPFVTGVLSMCLLNENPFSKRRLLALLLALFGLLFIFAQQLHVSAMAGAGILGVLLSSILFSLSSVLVKKLGTDVSAPRVDAFSQATGALVFSLPGLLLSWLLMDGHLPQGISLKSGGAVIYLALVGSLLGAALFFYILQYLSASSVSLVTLITPVIALALGSIVAGEHLSSRAHWGILLVLLALVIYTPWAWAEWLAGGALWLRRALQTPALSAKENPARLLEELKDDFIRHK